MMLITKKAYLAAALTSASLAALAMPTSAWAQAVANTTADCTEAVEETGTNPAATQFDPVTGDPILDPVTGDPVLVAAGDTIPFSTQCGVKSQASGSGSTALGNVADASGAFSTAIGAGSFALADGSVALGSGAFVASGATNSVAIGNGSEAIDDLTVSFGREEDLTDPLNPIEAITRRLTNVASGQAATDAVNVGQLAIALNGVVAGVNPLIDIDTTTLPTPANASGADAISFGSDSAASGSKSIAFGFDSTAIGNNAVAIGANGFVGNTGNNSVALGTGSIANDANVVSVGSGDAVDAGTFQFRKIINVANGTAANDAVNKGQLDAATVDDKFIAINPSAGAANASASVAGSLAIGGGSKANFANALVIGEDASADASGGVALGFSSLTLGTDGVAIGRDSDAQAQAISVGALAKASGSNSVAIGAGAKSERIKSIAIGDGARAFGQDGAIAIGADSTNSTAGTVSFGTDAVAAVGGVGGVAQVTRRLTNITAGTADTDAVNVFQLKDEISKVNGGANLFLDIDTTNFSTAASAGADSVALGGNSNASGLRSVALGSGSVASADNVVSVGSGDPADAGTIQFRKIVNVANGTAPNDAVNVKQLDDKFNTFTGSPFIVVKGADPTKIASANGPLAIAIGQGATSDPAFGGGIVIGAAARLFRGSVVIGEQANSETAASVVIGNQARAVNNSAQNVDSVVVLGDNANVAAEKSVALGFGSRVEAGVENENVVSVGSGLVADAATFQFRRIINVADGVEDNDATNLGQVNALIADATRNISAGGNLFVAVNTAGAAASATGVRSVAIGGGARATAEASVAIGEEAIGNGSGAVALGRESNANADRTIAIGASSAAFNSSSIAIGTSARAQKGGLALGDNAQAEFTGSIAIGTESATAEDDTVSFGNASKKRRVTNIADAKDASDAVTLGQVNTLIANAGVGGGAGGGVVAPANLFVAVKEVAGAAPANAAVAGTIALGGASNARAADTVAIGEGANAALAGATALGSAANASGAGATAIGRQASATSTNGTALGNGANVSLTADNSVALGAGSVATEANMVSIGSGKAGDAFATRRLTNVTAGKDGTDAVNINQLNEVKNLLTTGGVGNGFLAIDTAANANAANAAGAGSLALGGNSQALAANAVAVGNGAVAKDGAAVSIGLGNTASGNGAVAIGDPNTATGQGAVALGFTNTATGLAAVALGSESNALGVSAVAIGDGARAALDKKTTGSLETFADSNIAIGRKAQATAQTTIAIGNGAVANDEDATVIGDKSQAGFHATAVGGEVIASAAGAQAFGWQTNATGVRSTAVGFRANALAEGAMAIGANATVRATDTNSTAIGIGATTSRADQLVLGRAAGVAQNGTPFKGTSVTIADIAASTAAQSGPTDVMTVDASGTVGRDPSIRASISTLNGQVADLQKGQEELFDLVSFNRKEARRGIAAASALTAAPMPSEPGKTSFVAGTAFYRGEGAFSMSFNHRLNLDIPVAFGGGFAHSGGKDTVVRAHVATEF